MGVLQPCRSPTQRFTKPDEWYIATFVYIGSRIGSIRYKGGRHEHKSRAGVVRELRL